MNPIKTTLALLFFGTALWAQSPDEKNEISMAQVDQKPIYPGCDCEASEDARFECFNLSLNRFIAENITYPAEAKKDKVEGKVFVSFVIGRTGDIEDVKILRGVNPSLDQTAMDVIRKLPKIRPALYQGKTVRVQYTVPIVFKLS